MSPFQMRWCRRRRQLIYPTLLVWMVHGTCYIFAFDFCSWIFALARFSCAPICIVMHGAIFCISKHWFNKAWPMHCHCRLFPSSHALTAGDFFFSFRLLLSWLILLPSFIILATNNIGAHIRQSAIVIIVACLIVASCNIPRSVDVFDRRWMSLVAH